MGKQHSNSIGPATFDSDFRSAIRDDGLEVKFTRSESRLLNQLVRNAGRVLSRNQLLDAVSEPGSDKNDRNIDFSINRLRRKLNDDPKNPRFIATRYGEGYIWVAKAARGRPPASDAHVVVGPLRGLNRIGQFRSLATAFSHTFQAHLAKHFGSAHKVFLDPECPPRSAFGESCPEFAIDLTFLADASGLDCVFRAIGFRTDQIFCVVRRRIASAEAELGNSLALAEQLADQIASEIWRKLAVQPERPEPLPVQLHKASASMIGGRVSWQESERRLREVLALNPDDHLAKLLLATALHTKYIESGIELFIAGADTRTADEDEIEALVTDCLPFIQSEPFYAIMAAKLLYFVDRGYRRMAVELAENAHRASTAVAASLGTVGQMRVFIGQIDQGLASLDQALELCEPGSQFQLYLLVLKAQALLAAGDRAGLDATLHQLCAGLPELKRFLDIMFTSHIAPSPEALVVVQTASEARARAILMLVYYISARLFLYEDHRENILRTPVTLLLQRFGPAIVPKEVADAAPNLLRQLYPRQPTKPGRASSFSSETPAAARELHRQTAGAQEYSDQGRQSGER